ncbi:LysR family transcriptional regulator [Calidifontibacillus oryziterrae]|uniref:LysR family transcriptional regulator n=1 Tax=Calidifontibacillus oryziterrae TaxID=1191699 RepID=UPI0003002536|nr:LysR family transcriptional regulator [Calidifontibacillus oryziterrae]
MNIDHIEAFVYVFLLGSINRAAEALYLTQPTVSARIQTLERELNTKLFNRDGKQLTLSDKGKQFLPYAQSIIQTYQEAKIHLQTSTLTHNEMTIACSLSVSTHLVPEIMVQFRKQFPNVSVRILTGHSNDVLEKVVNKEVEFGIARTVTHPNIDTVLFHADPIELFVNPDHPLLLKDQVSLEDIHNEQLIFFEHGSIDWLMIYGLFESKRLNPNVILEVDSMETAKKMVMAGIGISFLPESCAREELKQNQLCKISIADKPPIARNIDFIFLKGEYRSPFLDFFMQHSLLQKLK